MHWPAAVAPVHAANMAVRVDEARHEHLAARIVPHSAVGDRSARGIADCDDPALVNDDSPAPDLRTRNGNDAAPDECLRRVLRQEGRRGRQEPD